MKEEKDENEKVNQELKDMKDKFKHLMSDYAALKKKVHDQHDAAAKFDDDSFKPEEPQDFDKETSKGLEEARNLVDAQAPE